MIDKFFAPEGGFTALRWPSRLVATVPIIALSPRAQRVTVSEIGLPRGDDLVAGAPLRPRERDMIRVSANDGDDRGFETLRATACRLGRPTKGRAVPQVARFFALQALQRASMFHVLRCTASLMRSNARRLHPQRAI